MMPFTRAPEQWAPTFECTAKAKSIGVDPLGSAFTSPLGVNTNTSSSNRSIFTVSMNSVGSFRSRCHSISWFSQAKDLASAAPSGFFSL